MRAEREAAGGQWRAPSFEGCASWREQASPCQSLRRCHLRDAAAAAFVRLRVRVGVAEGVQSHVAADWEAEAALVKLVDDLDRHLVGAAIPKERDLKPVLVAIRELFACHLRHGSSLLVADLRLQGAIRPTQCQRARRPAHGDNAAHSAPVSRTECPAKESSLPSAARVSRPDWPKTIASPGT